MAGKQNVTLELGWNVQPWVGALLWRMPYDIGVWKALPEGTEATRGRTDAFEIPALGAEKVKIDTVRGAEGNRGKPA
jgi:signal peptidase complex subunit 3